MTAPTSHRAHVAVLVAGILILAGGVALVIQASVGVGQALTQARHQGSLALAKGLAFVDQPGAATARAERAHLAARRAAFREVAIAERNRALGVLLALGGLLTATVGYALEHLQRDVADLHAMREVD